MIKMKAAVIYARVSSTGERQSTSRQVADLTMQIVTVWRSLGFTRSISAAQSATPSGIFWDKENDNYRTFDCNQALDIIQRMSDSYKNKNEEKFENFSSKLKLCQ